MRRIEIKIPGKGEAIAQLDDRNPGIAKELFQMLPIENKASLWGEEVYFEVPLQMDDENPSSISTCADISYWSSGPAFCIFFGQTQPYSPVNHLGKIIIGLNLFKEVNEGDRIVLSRK